MSHDPNKTLLTITDQYAVLDKECPYRPAGSNCGNWCPLFCFYDTHPGQDHPEVYFSCGKGGSRPVEVIRTDT